MFKPVSAKPDFVELERKWLKWWYESGLVEKYLHKNDSSRKKFSFLDGPITANNPMGVHHAWGRTYKDLWQRYYNMRGFAQRFQNGFDCQGLWVEVEVEKELGFKNKKDIEKYGIARFVNKCKERVLKFAKIQTEQSKRLGYFMDWENSYYTMSEENNYAIWHFLKVCQQNDWIYKGRDSVPWCPRCQTAISQHEMLTEDYKEVTHESIILKFPIVGREREFFLVWTTTPWTIPANIAVGVDGEIEYSLVKGGFNPKDKFWTASNLVEKVFQGKHSGIIKTVKGKELVGLKYRTVFDRLPAVSKVAAENPDRFHTVVQTDSLIMPISKEEGTGLVHTAVSAGSEDFKLGQKLDLPMIPVIADNADYLPGLGEFSGKNAKNNPRIILNYLEEREKKEECWVFSVFPYAHRYPACWRCKTELVWKVADEWYIAMDKIPNPKSQIPNGSASSPSQPSRAKSRDKSKIRNPKPETLREQMVKVAKRIKWLPEFGLKRELDWLKNMKDWLISKKRYWGLALPIWECRECSRFEVIGGKEELRKRAVRGWERFDGHTPHRPWVDEIKIKCPQCARLVSRIPDVGNPWLDAGIVPFSTMSSDWFPADFITESFPGQFKNWFYSLIAMATVLGGEPPFKTVLGFATLLAEDGRPMHKSWGNMIEFNKGAEKIGVDVMRWMYVRQNPEQNLLFGYKRADETRRKFHLLVWNIYKFFVTYANFYKLKRKKEKGKRTTKNLKLKNVLDKWIVLRLQEVVKFVSQQLDNYAPYQASEAIEEFVSDLSTWYVRRSREREDKENLLNTIYYVLITLNKLLAPFTPFLAEEIYKNLTGEESVHLADWPKIEKSKVKSQKSKVIIEEMRLVRKICELGHAQRKRLKLKVRQPLKRFKVQGSRFKITSKQLEQLIKDELNVKEIEWVNGRGELRVRLDTKITAELKEEGEARELTRKVQLLRKKAGCQLEEKIIIYAPSWPKKFTQEIKKKTLAKEIKRDKHLRIERAR